MAEATADASPLHGYSKLVERLCAGALVGAGVLLGSLVVVVFSQVALGWFKLPTPLWLGQYAQAAFIAFVFLALGPGVRARAHLSVEVFVAMMPARVQALLDRATAVLLAVFLAILTIWGARLAMDVRLVRLPETGWPQSVYFVAIPIGAFIATLAAIDLLIAPPPPRPLEAKRVE